MLGFPLNDAESLFPLVRSGFGRELQKWAPEEGEEHHLFHLEEDSSGWDQFAVSTAACALAYTHTRS